MRPAGTRHDNAPLTATGVVGIVLAGGAGRRLGRAKAAAPLAGQTLLERAVGLLGERLGEVIVVSRSEIPLPPVAVPVVHDRPGPGCPLNAILTGLSASTAAEALVLACDLPFSGPLLDALLAAPSGRAAAGAAGGRPQPLCARYPRAEAAEAAEDLLAAGELRAGALLERLGATMIPARDGALANVNTPDDLRRAARRLSHGDGVSPGPRWLPGG